MVFLVNVNSNIFHIFYSMTRSNVMLSWNPVLFHTNSGKEELLGEGSGTAKQDSMIWLSKWRVDETRRAGRRWEDSGNFGGKWSTG